ncbi:hypothetical protein [Aeromonas veronii]|uniref:hypothetical protein n=1 Tax=Aeromonas veronii TaxID=654 RepID=UPI003D1CDA25
MNTKKITKEDLSLELFDEINALKAQLRFLAQHSSAPMAAFAAAGYKASVAYQEEQQQKAYDRKLDKQYEEDIKALKSWAQDYYFCFANAEDAEKYVDEQWEYICKARNSEHGRNHYYQYQEPSYEQLFKAMKDMAYTAANLDASDKDKSIAMAALPVIREKMKAFIEQETKVE